MSELAKKQDFDAPEGEPDNQAILRFMDSGLIVRRPRYAVNGADRLEFDKITQILSDERLIQTGDEDDLMEILMLRREQLLRLDMLAGFKMALKTGEWNLQNQHLRVGAFGMWYPSLKDLNDEYLGPISTDRFMAGMQNVINKSLGVRNGDHANIFHMDFKGGSFLLDLQKFADSQNVRVEDAEAKLKEILKQLQLDVTEELKRSIQERILELSAESNSKQKRISEINHNEEVTSDERSEASRLTKEIESIQQNFTKLGHLKVSLEGATVEEDANGGVRKVEDMEDVGVSSVNSVPGYMAHVSFCLNKIEYGDDFENPEDDLLYLSLLNARRGVTINALRTRRISSNGSAQQPVGVSYVAEEGLDTLEDELLSLEEAESDLSTADEVDSLRQDARSLRSVLQNFDYVHLLMDLVRAREDLNNEVLDKSAEGSRLKNEWSEFFYIDESGEVRMKVEMIAAFRKQRTGRKYKDALRDVKKRRFFARYYDRVNVIDVLKNFRYENVDHYKQRVDGILSLVEQIDAMIESEVVVDVESLRALATLAGSELATLVKDEGDRITLSVRGAINELISDDTKAILFADHIGFGAVNQSNHEQIVMDIVSMLGLSSDEVNSIRDLNASDGALKAVRWNMLIKQKFNALKLNSEKYAEFVRMLLSVGDKGSKHLRDVEKLLHDKFASVSVNAKFVVGGDEITIYLTDLPSNLAVPENLRQFLEEISAETRLRVSGVIDDQGESPERDKVARYIRARRKAERDHAHMKGQGDRDPVTVVWMTELAGEAA